MSERKTEGLHLIPMTVLLEQSQIDYLRRVAVARHLAPRHSRSAVIRQIVEEHRQEHEEGMDESGKGHRPDPQ